jgi:polyisoprenoid-binding protein YceI
MFIANLTACNKDQNSTGEYNIDQDASVLEWKGIASDHFHTGAFDVTGQLHVQNGAITGGNITIPIASISNDDLPDLLKVQLLTHLKGPDFFNVAVHPNAVFKLKKVEKLRTADIAAATSNDYRITGDFYMIGQTHELSFPAKITLTRDSLQTVAAFKLNRLSWGMTSFNDPTKELYILPDVEIKLNIKAAIK